MSPAKGEIWYFAYGSNMSAATFRQGRGIEPQATLPVRIPGWTLTFEIYGVPYREPAFASITPMTAMSTNLLYLEKQKEVHGVAYLVTKKQYIDIVTSEGGGIAYGQAELLAEHVIVQDKNMGKKFEPFTVMTLITAFRCSPPRFPSLRYKEIMIHGAEELLLPESYRKYLELVPSYRPPEAIRRRLGATIFLAFWIPMMSFAEALTKVTANYDGQGNVPELVKFIVRFILRAMWLYHDFFHSYLWGRGDGIDGYSPVFD